MPHHSYRLYVLTAEGHIGKRCDLNDVECDEDAFKQAAILSANDPCEIWDLGRLVGHVPGPDARSARSAA
jgi:hypothetical protein